MNDEIRERMKTGDLRVMWRNDLMVCGTGTQIYLFCLRFVLMYCKRMTNPLLGD